MTEIDTTSERGEGRVWERIMQKTRSIRNRIWGDEQIPEREDDDK